MTIDKNLLIHGFLPFAGTETGVTPTDCRLLNPLSSIRNVVLEGLAQSFGSFICSFVPVLSYDSSGMFLRKSKNKVWFPLKYVPA